MAIYPEIEVSDCTVIPPGLREKISKEWGPPKVKMANAKKVRMTFCVCVHTVCVRVCVFAWFLLSLYAT